MGLNRVRRSGAYAPLSAHYYKDDAIDEAGPEAELLYVRGLAFCAEVLNDGFISDRQLTRFVGVGLDNVQDRARALVETALWEKSDGGYVVRSWLEWNRSRSEITRYQEKDAARKRGDEPDGSGPDPTPPGPPPQRSNEAPDEAPNGRPKPPPADSAPPSKRPPRGDHADSATASGGFQPPYLDISRQIEPEQLQQTRPKTSLAVLAGRAHLDRFPEFWATYPRKVKKRTAEAAWRAALKRGADPDQMITAAHHFADATRNREPRYVLHPATWLNSDAYNDPTENHEPPQKHLTPSDQNILNIQALKNRFTNQPTNNNTWRQLPGGNAS